MRAGISRTNKRSVSFTIDADLLDQAEAAGVDLSAVAEQALAAAVSARLQEGYRFEVEQACRAHDAYLGVYGALGEAVRSAAKDGQ